MGTAETDDVLDARTRAGDQAGKRAFEHAVTLQVRYFASAKAAAGMESEVVRLAPGASVADAVEQLRATHPESLPRILKAASFLLNGVAVRDLSVPVPDGGELDVLPPFAGG